METMKYEKGFFKGKKITIMGLGLLGRGVGDAAFFAEEGAEIIVTDLKSKEELAPSLEALKNFKNIKFVLGEHRLQDFRDRDFILKAAGVPLDSPYIEEARKNNVPVEMSTSLFASLTPATIVGVTGTRGKSTVTHLIYEILKSAYSSPRLIRRGAGGEAGEHPSTSQTRVLPSKKGDSTTPPNLPLSGEEKHIFLGGNVKGVSTLQFLPETKIGDIVVLELDSWQLQGFGDRKISPHISVFTTFLPDHLNYYHGSLDKYLVDKASIFKFQKENDFLILGDQAAPLVREKYGREIKSEVVSAGSGDLPADWKIQIPGLHNRYNCALALKTAELFNIDSKIIRKTIEEFRGVAGRLEFISDWNGIKIYNDTTATTPDATLAGLRAFGSGKSVVLIMGGADKSLDMKHLFIDMPVYTRAVILLPGTGSSRVETDLAKLENVHFEKADTLAEAVRRGLALARKGDNLLFSPGFTSFGMFKNEFERGDQFVEIVKNLK